MPFQQRRVILARARQTAQMQALALRVPSSLLVKRSQQHNRSSGQRSMTGDVSGISEVSIDGISMEGASGAHGIHEVGTWVLATGK